jgi:hypothetical protein
MRQVSRAVTVSAAMRRITVIRRIAAIAVSAAFIATGTVMAAPVAAASSHVFQTMNDSGGIYWRSGTNWNTPIRKSGYGVYPGTSISVTCYKLGTGNVPGSADAMWVRASWVSGPGTGSGWINEHFVNDGAPINRAAPGIPPCVSTPAPQLGPKSVFYSPNNTPDAVSGLTVADLNLVYDEWTTGGCSPSAAANIPNGVSILAGWSIGRLGPIYFLDAAGQRVSQVHTIILFDPGNTANFTGSSCDTKVKPSINSLLANWLKSNGSNRLIVLTGKVSEDQHGGRSTFAGLWKYYFAGIWNQSFASRAQVCDYHNLGHQQVLTDFAGMVQNPIHSCPIARGAPNPVAWNP